MPRCQAERTVAWFQKKYRRLVVRWERRSVCFNAFLAIAIIYIWIHRLMVGSIHGYHYHPMKDAPCRNC